MTHRYDVAIVGGGLVGAWSALFLARRGLSVVLFERGVVGAEASGTNFGSLRLQGRHPEQYPLSVRSQELWEDFEGLVGEGCEYERSGHFYCAVGDEDAERIEGYAALARSHGIEVATLDRDQIARRWPFVSSEVRLATYSPRDANANPRIATPAVARAAKAAGAVIVENCTITDIECHASGTFHLVTSSHGRIESGHLVNAAGAWAGEIAAKFGEAVPMFAAGPPQFVTEPLPYFMEPTVQRADGTVIARQVRRGNVIFAGYPRTAVDHVASRAKAPMAKIMRGMTYLRQTIPILAGARVIRVWSGIEGYMPDMIPVIGESATSPGLFHAFGFCGHGFQISPGVGMCISELVATGRTPTPLSAFAIDRFGSDTVVSEKIAREFDPSPDGHEADEGSTYG